MTDAEIDGLADPAVSPSASEAVRQLEIALAHATAERDTWRATADGLRAKCEEAWGAVRAAEADRNAVAELLKRQSCKVHGGDAVFACSECELEASFGHRLPPGHVAVPRQLCERTVNAMPGTFIADEMRALLERGK